MRDRLFVALTALATLMTMVVSVVVVVDPAFALPQGTPVTVGAETYARACCARSLAVGGVLLVLLARRSRPGLVALLWVSGFIQVGDALVHVLNGNPMAAAAGVLAVVAFGSAWWFRQSPTNGRINSTARSMP